MVTDAKTPFPGTPIDINPANLPGNLPVHICLKNGFQANKVYQLVYTGTNAYVLGVGMAFRDGLAVVSSVGMALMSVAYAAAMAAGAWAWIVEPLVTWSRLAT
jgi:hypothetical protein